MLEHRINPTFSKSMPLDFTSYLFAASPPQDFFHEYKRLQRLQLSNAVPTPEIAKDPEPTSPAKIKRAVTDGCLAKPGRKSPQCKKTVSFADDHDKSLERVKYIQEAPDVPPVISPQVIAAVTSRAATEECSDTSLQLDFPQPCADYMDFRDRIEKNNVSLENVIIREPNTIHGSVKVKNLSYHKDVVVRYTTDNWATNHDLAAQYTWNAASGGRLDTFEFDLQVPPSLESGQKVEFCIRYESDGQQFWDSNNGQNYKVGILGKEPEPEVKFDLATEIPQFPHPGEFAFWQNVETESPYW